MASKANGLGILAKRVVQQQARLVRPVRGGGHHQEHADPAKYGKFLLPHVADGHKQVAKACATVTWFWIMYRGYHDLPHLLGYHQFYGDGTWDH